MNVSRNSQFEQLFLQTLRAMIGETRFSTWLVNVRFELKEDALVVKTPNEFYSDWLRSSFSHYFVKALRDVLGLERQVRFVCDVSQSEPTTQFTSNGSSQNVVSADAYDAPITVTQPHVTPLHESAFNHPTVNQQASFLPFPQHNSPQQNPFVTQNSVSRTDMALSMSPQLGFQSPNASGAVFDNLDSAYANRVFTPSGHGEDYASTAQQNYDGFPRQFGAPQSPMDFGSTVQNSRRPMQGNLQPPTSFFNLPVVETGASSQIAATSIAPTAPVKRKRGRPRKNPLPEQQTSQPTFDYVASSNQPFMTPPTSSDSFSFADTYNRTLLASQNATQGFGAPTVPEVSEAERASLSLGEFYDVEAPPHPSSGAILPPSNYPPTITPTSLLADAENMPKQPRRRGRPVGSTNRKKSEAERARQGNEVSRDANGYNIVSVPREKPRIKAEDVARRRFASLRSFVIGPSNNTAVKIAELAIASPGMMSPVYINGSTSVGKTHLLEGICDAYARNPNFATKPPLYMTAEQFTTAFIHSLQGGSPFRDRFRNISLLALDDLNFLEGKKSTQTEFVHVLDFLHNRRVQVVITGNKPLNQFTELRDELVTRIQTGVYSEIAAPERETLAVILQRMAVERGLYISDEVCRFVVSRFATHAREISGALNRLYVAHLETGETITLDFARAALASLTPVVYRNIRLEDVEQVVQSVFSLEPKALKSPSRAKKYSDPRAIAMWLARKYTRAALAEIGAYFGGRRHSAALIAQRKVDGWIKDNASVVGINNPNLSVAEIVKALERELMQMSR